MNILLIEQAQKRSFVKKLFKPLEIKEKKVIINVDLNKINIKRKIKLVKKLKNILNNNDCQKVLISKILKNDIEFINLLYSSNIDIIDGKKLFKMYILDIVDYIVGKQNLKKEECKIAITTNQYNGFIEKVIKSLSVQCKCLQVVTNHIDKFRNIEDNLYEEGVIVTVTNNKRKSLLNSNIILNIDFPKEILNMYNIYDKAIIVNFEEEVKIKKKRFSGIVIDWYNLGIKENSIVLDILKENNLEIYDLNELVEYYYYLDKIQMNEVFLKNLICSSGRII